MKNLPNKKEIDDYWINHLAKRKAKDMKDIHLPNPLEPFHYDILYNKMGVLRKEQLVDGKYYRGFCRNADVAMWDEKENCFWYMRHKFGDVFAEKINHLDDDNFHDLFVPVEEVEPKENEIIKNE